MPRPRIWDTHTVLQAIQYFVRMEHGVVPRSKDFTLRRHGLPHHATAREFFPTRQAAVNAAGFPFPTKQTGRWRQARASGCYGRRPYWNTATITRAIQDYAVDHQGYAPRPYDFCTRAHGLPSYTTVHRYFPSIRRAIEAAGLTQYRPTYYPTRPPKIRQRRNGRPQVWDCHAICVAIQHYIANTNTLPRSFDFIQKRGGLPSYSTLRKYFASIAMAIEAAGFPYTPTTTPHAWRRSGRPTNMSMKVA